MEHISQSWPDSGLDLSHFECESLSQHSRCSLLDRQRILMIGNQHRIHEILKTLLLRPQVCPRRVNTSKKIRRVSKKHTCVMSVSAKEQVCLKSIHEASECIQEATACVHEGASVPRKQRQCVHAADECVEDATSSFSYPSESSSSELASLSECFQDEQEYIQEALTCVQEATECAHEGTSVSKKP